MNFLHRIAFFALFGLLLTPSLKAQDNFEGTIVYNISAQGQMASAMQGQMPDRMELFFRDKQMLMRINGMPGGKTVEMLVDNENGHTYSIDHDNKTVTKIITEEETETPDMDFEEFDGEFEVAGYTCSKARTTMENPMAGTMTMTYFATEDIKPYVNEEVAQNTGNNLFAEGLDGFPLKMVTAFDQMDLKVVYMADQVMDKKPEEGLFMIPDDYTVEEKKASEMGR